MTKVYLQEYYEGQLLKVRQDEVFSEFDEQRAREELRAEIEESYEKYIKSGVSAILDQGRELIK